MIIPEQRFVPFEIQAWSPLRIALGLCTALLLLLPAAAFAQDTRPEATLDKDLMLIGQQAHIDLQVTYRADSERPTSILWPSITDTLTAHLEVVHDSGVDTILPEKERDPYLFQQRRTLTITSWDSGYWAVPPFSFVINGDTMETEAMLITVNTVEVDTAGAFKDIKEIYEVPWSWVDWVKENWPWLAGGAAALAAIIWTLVWFVRRKRKPAEPIAPSVPELPLHERTIQALRALEQKHLWQQGLVKEYHSGVTDIVRGYIEERFQVPAMESTTDELLSALKLSSMNGSQREQLANLLRMADMVKFAKWTPVPTENEHLLAGAITLVEQTSEARGHA